MFLDGYGCLDTTRRTPKKKWNSRIEEPVFVQGKFNVKRAQAR
jgi:hypothetical protein